MTDGISGVKVDAPIIERDRCAICGNIDVKKLGNKRSDFSGRVFTLMHCEICRFSFVKDPWTDFADIYGEEYFAGRGADPMVDYTFDASNPESSTQRYEWLAIADLVEAWTNGRANRWLDYGCGMGGLVNQLRHDGRQAFGYEQAAVVPALREAGVPIIEHENLAHHAQSFDVVTMTEVLEHTMDPVGELRRARSLLKPTGVLFVMTGNAQPFRDRLLEWRYVTPDVHISFFEPKTLATAMEKAGLRPEWPGYVPAWSGIYRSKVFHTLRIHKNHGVYAAAPWGVIARMLEKRLKLAQQPIGRA